jgi:hypothetical protein
MSYEEIPYHEHYDLDRGVRDVQQELWTAQEALNDLRSELSTLRTDADELRETVAWLRMEGGGANRAC